AGAGTPTAAAALLDLLHELVAVARLLGEQEQERQGHIAPALAPPTPAEERTIPAPAGQMAERRHPLQLLRRGSATTHEVNPSGVREGFGGHGRSLLVVGG